MTDLGIPLPTETVEWLTTAQAAKHCDLPRSTFTREMARERSRGNDLRADREHWIDGRTPTYDPAALDAWLANRPGRGTRTDRQRPRRRHEAIRG